MASLLKLLPVEIQQLSLEHSEALAVRPNPSLKPTRYGRQRKAGLWHFMHHHSPALRRPPPPAGLTRTLGRAKPLPHKFAAVMNS